jgi:hypothetical protein
MRANMHERRLKEIKEFAEAELRATFPLDAEDFARRTKKDTLDLVAEIERLNGRLEAVCDVLSDADAFDGVISDELVMRAVRGE